MPEGDTLFRTARSLRTVLLDKVILRARSSLLHLKARELEGRRVLDVEAYGKNLFIRLDDETTLYSHLRMTGSWHIYQPTEPWQKPERYMKVALDVGDFMIVCFSAPQVELWRTEALARDPRIAGLGPDILQDDFDISLVTQEFLRRSEYPLGEAVMSQRLVSGIGNIYKSETLFVCGADPFAQVKRFTEDEIRTVLKVARDLMLSNLVRERKTTPDLPGMPNFWAYGRRGRPCLECREPIRVRRQGEAARTTYYCPTCQPTRG